MALIILRRAEERRTQNATIGKMSSVSRTLDHLALELFRQQATMFALEVNEFVRDVMRKECDRDFAEHVVMASFSFFHDHMPPDEMYDGDVRRVVGAYKAWLRSPHQISTWSEEEIEELTDKILETAFQQIYPDHFMYINIVHSYCKNAIGFDCSSDLAVKTLDTFFEILRTFQDLGFDAALIRTVNPFKLWLAETIRLPEDHINALFTFLLQTIHEIYF